MSGILESRRFQIFALIVLPIILALITLYLSGTFSRRGSHIAIELLQKGILVDVDERIAPDVSVSYRDILVSRVQMARLRIRNSGTQGISNQTDVIQPLTFSFPTAETLILGKGVVQEKRPDEIVVSQKLSDDGTALQVEFDLLNKGWWFVFDILYSCPETCLPIVEGKIKNVNMEEVTSVLDRTDTVIPESADRKKLTAPTMWLLLGSCYIHLAALWLIVRRRREIFDYFYIIAYSAIAISALVFGSLFSVRYFKGSSVNIFVILAAELGILVGVFVFLRPVRKER